MREELHPLPLLLAEEVAEAEEEEEEDSSVHSESPPPPSTPQNPTPPRMRRGSWTFNKSRERNKKSLTATSSTPRQRARSNSVPAVLSLTQLPLFRHSWIPQIVVSGEEPEAEPEVADVVEGFSWTLAESIIEDILKEMEASSRRPYHQLPLPVDTGSRKGILKNASNDSLYRSCSGSLEEPPNGSQSDNGKPTGSDHIPIPETVSSEALSWSHRSTSMPSLRAIDQDFRNSSGCPQVSWFFLLPLLNPSGSILPASFPSMQLFNSQKRFFFYSTPPLLLLLPARFRFTSGSLSTGSLTRFRIPGFLVRAFLCS